MATLTQATQSTRTILKWAGIAFAAFLIIRLIVFPIGKGVYNMLFPTKPPAPTTAYGKLPKIPFLQNSKSKTAKELEFVIKTTSASLPQTPSEIPDRLNIYQIKKPQASFSSLDRAKQKVANIGFSGEEMSLSDIVYKWRDPKIEGREIIFNIVTESFTLTSPLSSQDELAKLPPQKEEAINIAKGFFARMSLLPFDLDDARTKTSLFKISNKSLVKATSLSESNFIRVDFYRKSFTDLPIVNPNPGQPLLSTLIQRSNDTNSKVIQAQYAYKTIDSTESSTYPIKTAKEALEDLKEGKGYIYPVEIQSPISIRKVYLTYFEGDDDLEFLLPVFVFEGDDGFTAYVEAVRAEWVE